MRGTDPRRQLLLELLQAALAAVDGRRCTARALSSGGVRHRGGTRRSAGADGAEGADAGGADGAGAAVYHLAAVGKAACAMALGAHDALGDAIGHTLIIAKDGHIAPEAWRLPGVTILESGHPVPDERSLLAGERLLQFVDTMPEQAEPIFLISGGASSLVEVLAPGVTLAQLRQLNAAGLASGEDIESLNRRRRELSAIKGGRLAARLGGRPALALFISDVPEDDPAVIGSGLLAPVAAASCGNAADAVERRVIARIEDAMQAAGRCVPGLKTLLAGGRFSEEAGRLAVRFTHDLAFSSAQLCIWGGESVVRLPARPGRGGRNQHLALAAARLIAGQEELLLLAAGTDGTDGPTAAAGALVDGDTCARAAVAGFDVEDCLRRADSHAALQAAGDLVHTGPTGTNVGDLVLGLKLSREEARTRFGRGSLRAASEPVE